MTRCFAPAWCFALAWGCLTSPAARGQSPLLLSADQPLLQAGPAPPLTVSGPLAAPPLLPPEGAAAHGSDGAWKMDLILGLPTGVRLQRLLHPDQDRGLVLEGFAGLYTICPTVGGGLRWRCAPVCGRHDALILSPGVDAYALLNPLGGFIGDTLIGIFTADVDCAWQHQYGDRLAGELGVKLGGGVGVSSRTVPLPVVGVYGGFRY